MGRYLRATVIILVFLLFALVTGLAAVAPALISALTALHLKLSGAWQAWRPGRAARPPSSVPIWSELTIQRETRCS